jgi:glycosyltransferase involved in cell wall biosynthesis
MPSPPTPAPPDLALVVCTRDRAERLPATLAALGALRSARPWELVLVDNQSRDATPAVLAAFAAGAARAPAVPGAPVAVTVLAAPLPGLARARNVGVAAARAPVLCFTDDDCYPAADFLDQWAAVFDDPAVGYGGGRIDLHDPADYPITVRVSPEPVALRPGAYVDAGLIQGANMAFRRAVLSAAGGFDEGLGPGTRFNCEDVDMAARAAAAGAAGGYFPGPRVRHHHGRRAGPAVDALRRSYTHGRGAYHAALLLRSGARKHGAWAWSEVLRGVLAPRAARLAWGRSAGEGTGWSRARRELAGGAEYLAARVAAGVAARAARVLGRAGRREPP